MLGRRGNGSPHLGCRILRALYSGALLGGLLAGCNYSALRTERIFQSLERATETDGVYNFAVGARCYRLEQSRTETFPRLMQRDCDSQSTKLMVDFATIMPGTLKLIRGLRVSPDGSQVAVSGLVNAESTLFVVKILPRGHSARSPTVLGTAPFEFEWFEDSKRLLLARNEAHSAVTLSQVRTDTALETALPFHPQSGRYLHLERASAGTFLYLVERAAFSDRWSAIPTDDREIEPRQITDGTSRAFACESSTHRIIVQDALTHPIQVELIPHRGKGSRILALTEAVTLQALNCFSSGAVLTVHDGWAQHVYWINPSAQEIRLLQFPGQWHSVPSGQPFQSQCIEFRLEGLVMPPQRGWFCSERGVISLEAVTNLPPPVVENFEVPTPDGAAIPVVAISASSPNSTPGQPILLHTYGAYGQAVSQRYNPQAAELLRLGFRYVIAHIRGGSGRGVRWHMAGSGESVARRVEDLIAVAEHLHHRYHPTRIFGFGRSAGAVPLLAAASNKPSLFGAILLDAPLLRPVPLEGIIPGWERQEWGPFNRSIDPLTLLEDACPPPSFISFSQSDQMVSAADILEYAARAATLYGAANSMSLVPVSASGHAGADYHEAENRLAARQIEFLLTQIGR